MKKRVTRNIKQLLNKFTSLSPGAQVLISVLLLAVLFIVGDFMTTGISTKSAAIKVLSSLLIFMGNSFKVIFLGLATITCTEMVLLLIRKCKSRELRKNEPLSEITYCFAGSYVGAMCLVCRDFFIDIHTTNEVLRVLFSGVGWIIAIIGIAVMLIAAFKMILIFNRKEDNAETIYN